MYYVYVLRCWIKKKICNWKRPIFFVNNLISAIKAKSLDFFLQNIHLYPPPPLSLRVREHVKETCRLLNRCFHYGLDPPPPRLMNWCQFFYMHTCFETRKAPTYVSFHKALPKSSLHKISVRLYEMGDIFVL